MTEVENVLETFEQKKAAKQAKNKGNVTVQEQFKEVEANSNQPELKPYADLKTETKLEEAEIIIGDKKETVADKKENNEESSDQKPETKKFWQRRKPEESTKEKQVLIPVEIEEELKYLRAQVADPTFKQAQALKKSGKNFLDFAEEISSKNPAKMPLVEIFKLQMQDAGKSGAELNNLVEQFEIKDELDQITLTSGKKRELQEQYKNSFNTAEDAPDDTVKNAVAQRKAWEEFNNEIDAYVDSYKGKEHLGIKVTEKMVDAWKEGMTTAIPKRENGTFEPQTFADRDFLYVNREQIFESIYNQGMADMAEAKKENETHSGKHTQTNASPISAGGKKELTGRENFEKNIKPSLEKITQR